MIWFTAHKFIFVGYNPLEGCHNYIFLLYFCLAMNFDHLFVLVVFVLEIWNNVIFCHENCWLDSRALYAKSNFGCSVWVPIRKNNDFTLSHFKVFKIQGAVKKWNWFWVTVFGLQYKFDFMDWAAGLGKFIARDMKFI